MFREASQNLGPGWFLAGSRGGKLSVRQKPNITSIIHTTTQEVNNTSLASEHNFLSLIFKDHLVFSVKNAYVK